MTATGAESRTHCLLTERAPLLDGLPLGEAANRGTVGEPPGDHSRKLSDNH